MVVRTLPTSTTNITGFFISVRGLSLRKLSPTALAMIGPLISEPLDRTRPAFVSPGAIGVGSSMTGVDVTTTS